jgi:hypothetical protein
VGFTEEEAFEWLLGYTKRGGGVDLGVGFKEEVFDSELGKDEGRGVELEEWFLKGGRVGIGETNFPRGLGEGSTAVTGNLGLYTFSW